MRVVIFGGAGFVGLNIVEALLRAGNHVTAFDINPIPPAALAFFESLPGQLLAVEGDIRDAGIARAAIGAGTDAVILGAAVTAGSAREAAEPTRIMAVNLGALVPLLERAREVGVQRIVNLSSVAAYGQATRDKSMLEEQDATWPVSLYAISKLASEQILARLAALWRLDACSLRLSTVFGPWEHDTGNRDSLSPPLQVMRAAFNGAPALLPRDSRRDWIYAPDVAAGVIATLQAKEVNRVYNLTGTTMWSLLDWGPVDLGLAAGLPMPSHRDARDADHRAPFCGRSPANVAGSAHGRGGLVCSLRARRIGQTLRALVVGASYIRRRGGMRLDGQVAIVTGGGSGIGRASALRFAEVGAKVAIVDRDADRSDETLALIVARGGEAMALHSDVSAAARAKWDAEAVLTRFGRIDVLMTAAGYSCGGTVLTTAPEDWDAVIATNLSGTWLWCRAVIPAMQAQKHGVIVTVASQLAVAGGANNSAYIAAKGAILSLTRTMALDFAKDGIRINALVPGAVDTPMLARGFNRHADPEAAKATSMARHALKRFGRVEELAEAALYLASAASSFTTGTALASDGGWLAG